MRVHGLAVAIAGGVAAAFVVAIVAALGVLANRSDVRHKLYYDVLYTVVARHVTAGAANQADAVDRLAHYVFMSVHAPDDAPLDEDGPPAVTLTRGYGYCDQQVRLFMRLAQAAGYSSKEIFLLDTIKGDSPHTVAEVNESGRWAMLDVFYGYAAKDADGSPATMDEVIARSDPIIQLAGLTVGDYQDSRVELQFQPTPVDGIVSRLLPGWLADRFQDWYLTQPPPDIPVPQGSRFTGYASPDGTLYWRARNHDVFDRAGEAQAEYTELLAKYPNSPYANDARYYLSLRSSSSDPQSSIELVKELQTHDPVAGLLDEALYVAGLANERIGGQDCATAMSLFAQVGGHVSSITAPAALFHLGDSPCTAALQKPLAQFGPLQLEGVSWTAGDVSLVWRAADPMSADYTVFVHALDSSGHVVAQHDGQPHGGQMPTSTWWQGAIVPDDHELTLPPQTAQLEIGAYVLKTGERLKQADGSDTFKVKVDATRESDSLGFA